MPTDYTQGLTKNELQRYEAEQYELYKKRRAEDKVRGQEEDARYIKKHGAIPGTQEWYKKTTEINEVDRLTRNRDDILSRIRELEKPESYTMPMREGGGVEAFGVTIPERQEEIIPKSGIYQTGENAYSNIGSVAGQRARDSLVGAEKYNRLKKRLNILGESYVKPTTLAGKLAKEEGIGLGPAIKRVAELGRAPEKDTDFKFAYSMRRDESQTPGEFRNKVYDPKSAPGKLTENTVLRTISDQSAMVNPEPGKTIQHTVAKWYGHYQDVRKTNPKMDREEAMNRTLQEMTKITLPAEFTPETNASEVLGYLMENYGMTEQQGRAWLRAN